MILILSLKFRFYFRFLNLNVFDFNFLLRGHLYLWSLGKTTLINRGKFFINGVINHLNEGHFHSSCLLMSPLIETTTESSCFMETLGEESFKLCHFKWIILGINICGIKQLMLFRRFFDLHFPGRYYCDNLLGIYRVFTKTTCSYTHYLIKKYIICYYHILAYISSIVRFSVSS